MEGSKKRAPRPLILFLYPVLVLSLLGILIQTSAEPVSVLDLLKKQYPIDARLLERIANHLEGLGDPARIRAALDRDDEPPTMPAGLTAEASGPELLFSHFADGAFGGLAFRSTYTLVNNSTQPSDGTVDFFDDSGNPLHITIDGVTDSSFPFQLGVGQSTRLVTEGTGAIQSGWARVRSSQPISATSSFGSFDGTRVVTDVGVAASTAGSEFMIFADTIGESNTGVALANPNQQPITVDLILRDREAVERGRGELELPALGHVARFVDQLFPDVAGIDEFEGSLLIRSRAPQAAADVSPSGQAEAPEFVGLTLRVIADLLTSLPMVAPAREDAEFTRLAFAQVADGSGFGLTINSTFILFNNTDSPVSGVLELFQSNASPMEVTLGGVTSSSFDFQLEPGQVWRRTTSGEGDVQVGWGRVTMDQPIAGSGIFTTRNETGQIVSEVGVGSSELSEQFDLIVDTQGSFNTGLALAFPISPGISSRDVAGEVRFRFELFDSNGVEIETAALSIQLERFEHRALFVNEIFPNFDDFANFDGWLRIRARDRSSRRAPAPVAILALRSAVEKLTSTPALLPQFGFAPFSELRPEQTLATTAPPVRFRLVQNSGDMQLSEVTLSAPGLGLNSDAVEAGSFFGYVTLDDNGVGRLVATGEGSIEFDLLGAEAEPFENVVTYAQVLQGRMDGDPDGNLLVTLSVPAEANTFQATSAIWDFFLDPGIIQAPASAGPVEVTTEYVSVSRSSRRDEGRIRRQISQTIDFQAPSASRANLESTEPRFPLANEPLTLRGSNFGSEPVVEVPVADGSTRRIPSFEATDSELRFHAPSDLLQGPIAVDNGQGLGNPLETRILFRPEFELLEQEDDPGTPEDESGLGFRLTPTGDEFEFDIFSFSVFLQDVSADFSELTPGDMVGTVQAFGLPLRLVVDQVEGEVLSLNGEEEGGFLRSTLRVEPSGDDLAFTYAIVPLNSEPDGVTPALAKVSNVRPTTVFFPGLPLQGLDSGSILVASAAIRSYPTDVGGIETGFEVIQFDLLEIP